MKPYLYIFIREDLSNPQKVVQSSHLAWEVSKKYNLDIHPSMIVIGAKDLNYLHRQKELFQEKQMEVLSFIEPMFNNEMTAIGILTMNNEERSHFRKFQLLKPSSFTKEYK